MRQESLLAGRRAEPRILRPATQEPRGEQRSSVPPRSKTFTASRCSTSREPAMRLRSDDDDGGDNICGCPGAESLLPVAMLSIADGTRTDRG